MTEVTKAIAQALTLATRLRSLSEKTRDSQFRGIVAELLLELAEVQIKLDALLAEHAALKAQLRAHPSPQAERCPRCHELGWKLAGSRTVRSAGHPDRLAQTYVCSKCGLKEEVLVTPG
jgi:hypothetical protein